MDSVPRIFIVSLLWSSTVISQMDRLEKPTVDDDRNFTNVGLIGLTVTNFGTIGTRNAYWPTQPSCEYPRGSGIEHLYQGGVWVGAQVRRTGDIYVSTGASDQATRPRGETRITGFEFSNAADARVVRRSSLSYSADFTPSAISHQDFIAEYADLYRRVPATGDTILEHTPLGIKIRQESYAWNFPATNAFVLIQYTLYNVGSDTLDSVYVGLYAEKIVRNTTLVHPFRTAGSIYFNRSARGYDPQRRLAYAFDYADSSGAGPNSTTPGDRTSSANSYIGIRLLGTVPFPPNVDSLGDLRRNTYFNAWAFRAVSGVAGEYFSPDKDIDRANPYLSRYSRLRQSLPQQQIDQLRTGPYTNINNTLLSVGPLAGDSVVFDPYERHIPKAAFYPGDSLTVTFAVVCAPMSGGGRAWWDSVYQRARMYENADWAQRAYNGEDRNGNNRLDGELGEDYVGRTEMGLVYEPDNRLTRYLLPLPPRQPRVRVEVQSQSVVVYWDSTTAEDSIDPLTQAKDFEGYRIYRTRAGADFQSPETFLLNLQLVGEFDRPGNTIGYNTGFSRIRLDSAVYFPGDDVAYRYRFPPKDTIVPLLNGWQYVYGISTFDRGDSLTPSLESAPVLVRVVPGTPAAPQGSGTTVGVYPNPYYAHAYWDGGGERLRKIYFYNLPERCEIRIYTLAGDIVAQLDHDGSTYNGLDIQWFRTFGDAQTPPQFAGGEHAWDLITRHDQAIASGLYLFSVKDKQTGEVQQGKFLIIK